MFEYWAMQKWQYSIYKDYNIFKSQTTLSYGSIKASISHR